MSDEPFHFQLRQYRSSSYLNPRLKLPPQAKPFMIYNDHKQVQRGGRVDMQVIGSRLPRFDRLKFTQLCFIPNFQQAASHWFSVQS